MEFLRFYRELIPYTAPINKPSSTKLNFKFINVCSGSSTALSPKIETTASY